MAVSPRINRFYLRLLGGMRAKDPRSSFLEKCRVGARNQNTCASIFSSDFFLENGEMLVIVKLVKVRYPRYVIL